MNKEITIYDIAKDAEVSPTTVSRALNDHQAVNEKTKQKVMKVAERLGYQSNIFASNLRSKHTHNIGVIVPNLKSPFQSSALAGMEKIANENNYNLIISQSLESNAKERANANTMFKSRVDGLLVSLAGNTKNIDHFKPFSQRGIPVLFFDRISVDSNYTGISIDNVEAGYKATEHLIRQGCKKIAHVLGNLEINVYSDRLKGYRFALLENDLPYNKSCIFTSALNEDDCEKMVEKILALSPIPDGLFVSNDTIAAIIINSLKSHKIKVPADIAVIGFNNDPISRLIEPKLSTINYPGFEMGEVAMNNLIYRMKEKPSNSFQNTNTITLRSELIVRDSTLKQNHELSQH